MSPGPGSAKQVTRREVRRTRAGRGVDERAATALALGSRAEDLARLLAGRETVRRGAARGGPCTALYVSLPAEPGTGPLRQQLLALGHEVLLPWLRADRDLDWVRDEGLAGDPLRPPGPRLGPQAVASADLVLVPALAVDGSGTRLGQGGGSYDRSLVRLRRPAPPFVLAVVHDEEVLPAGALPAQPHDVAVDGALTPSGLHLFDRG
ncbi:5-formyltetrahydrofolate cyclo-ligase [Jannaschia sp. R86511]|uniref:5-formyltetrahydrofolate cyclo-ligase n=1 Tax=Jannaschia sp. R86511 TaxID=3093853 RepID=UPI0036D43387